MEAICSKSDFARLRHRISMIRSPIVRPLLLSIPSGPRTRSPFSRRLSNCTAGAATASPSVIDGRLSDPIDLQGQIGLLTPFLALPGRHPGRLSPPPGFLPAGAHPQGEKQMRYYGLVLIV